MNTQNFFSSLFKEEYLERFVLRNEEFRKLFFNLNKFLSEVYKNYEGFGRSLQKISFTLEDYLKKLPTNDKNCFPFARNFSNSLSSFGEDSSKLFNSLSGDMNLSLSEVHEKISANKKNHLDLLIFTLSNFTNSEMEYLKLLGKYKTYSRASEDSLMSYNESLKEAKTIYNLSLMNRNLSKLQKLISKTLKYEEDLKNCIANLNNQRRNLAGIILETLHHFKMSYIMSLSKFFEISKKNFDAMSSFMSLFNQIMQQKRDMLKKLEVPEHFLPNSHDFKMSSSLLENETNEDQRKNSIEINEKTRKFPDFIEFPEKIAENSYLSYYELAQSYTEKYFRICQERRKILKHIKIGVKELAEEHENLSRSLMKVSKNIIINASWSTFGEQLFAISQLFNQTVDHIIKKTMGFSNFTQMKLGVLESILMDIEKAIKINYATTLQVLKDHFNIRLNLSKLQNSKANNKKPTADLITQTRNSIQETSKIIKKVFEDSCNDERKRIEIFKENLMTILSQMEYYFLEICEFLKSNNEKIFHQLDKDFINDVESVFFKLISSDNKMSELFTNKYNETINHEKEKDIEFFRDFDPDSHPLYLKIFPDKNKKNQNNDDIEPLKAPRDSIKKEEEKRGSSSKIELNLRNGLKESISNINNNEDNNLSPEDMERKEIDKNAENERNSISNFDSASLRRRKSLESNEVMSPGLEDSNSAFKTIKAFRCDEINENGDLSDSEKKTPTPFDLTTSPKKKKNTYKFFNSKFGLTQGEAIDSVFSCALSDKMLVQGKMFISNKKIGFHSYFNKQTFIGETKMIIPKKDIIKIEKRYNALIFDNSIAIVTPNGELFFTSFVFRDKAYIRIIKVIQPIEQKDLAIVLAQESNNNNNNNNIIDSIKNNDNLEINNPNLENKDNQQNEAIINEVIDPALQKKLEERAKMVWEIVPKDDFFNDHIFTLKLPSYIRRIEDVYRILFSNEIMKFKGKEYKGYWEYLKIVLSEDIDFLMTDFNPPPPKFYQNSENLEELVSFPHYSERKIEFTHPVRKTGIPFMPKTCPVKEVQKLYWVNHKEFRLIGDVRSEKVPYTDCFYICVMYRVIQKENKNIEIITRFKIVWVKSTILKDTIEKRVGGETIETTNNIVFPSFLDFIKNVYNSPEYQTKYPFAQKGNEAVNNEIKPDENNAAAINNEEKEELLNKINACNKQIQALESRVKSNEIIIYSLLGVLIMKVLFHLISYFFFE